MADQHTLKRLTQLEARVKQLEQLEAQVQKLSDEASQLLRELRRQGSQQTTIQQSAEQGFSGLNPKPDIEQSPKSK